MSKRDKASSRPMPMGNPANFPIGSPESRAAARAMIEAHERAHTIILLHRIPRPSNQPQPEIDQETGCFITRITCAEPYDGPQKYFRL